jgi:hypothetical protein
MRPVTRSTRMRPVTRSMRMRPVTHSTRMRPVTPSVWVDERGRPVAVTRTQVSVTSGDAGCLPAPEGRGRLSDPYPTAGRCLRERSDRSPGKSEIFRMWRICDSQQLVGARLRRCREAEDMSLSDRHASTASVTSAVAARTAKRAGPSAGGDRAGAFYAFSAVNPLAVPLSVVSDRAGAFYSFLTLSPEWTPSDGAKGFGKFSAPVRSTSFPNRFQRRSPKL